MLEHTAKQRQALDIEIKRSENKIKYMESQLFPNGLPSSRASTGKTF